MRIFCDLDGVLANFDKEASRIKETEHYKRHTIVSREDFWSYLNTYHRDFWENLEYMNHGKKIWDLIKEYSPTILSAATLLHVESFNGKRKWVRDTLGIDTPILITMKQFKYSACSSSSDILIDDDTKNLDDWRKEGGVAIYGGHDMNFNDLERVLNTK